jgi:hypothetical protein
MILFSTRTIEIFTLLVAFWHAKFDLDIQSVTSRLWFCHIKCVFDILIVISTLMNVPSLSIILARKVRF